MSDFRPPPQNEKFLWHWIETPCGAEPWMWCDQMWTPASCRVPSDMTIHTGCRYLYPADPAAITLDPDDERQVEMVSRVHEPLAWEWYDRTADAGASTQHQRSAFRKIALGKAGAVIEALKAHR